MNPLSLPGPIEAVDTHTGGEPTRVVVGGLPPLGGGPLSERNARLLEEHPGLASFLAGEPRGHAPMHAALPLPPSDPRADFSLLILSALGSLDMCGHALIGAVTALIETGEIAADGPERTVRVETLAGLVEAEARITPDGHVESVEFRNAPARAAAGGVGLEVPGVGEVVLDLAYGGLWYAVLDAASLGLEIEPANVPRLVADSARIRRVLNQHLERRAPGRGLPDFVPQLLYTSSRAGEGADGRNMATSTELGFDRSPCGTGSCARMALLHHRGRLGVGDSFVHESVVGSRFTGTILAEVDAPGGPAVIPSIRGSAFITGYNRLAADPRDPMAAGFFIPAADSEGGRPA